MISVKQHTDIYIDEKIQESVKELVKCLDDMNIPLTNTDYAFIFKAIAETDPDVEGIDDVTIHYTRTLNLQEGF